MLRTKFKVLGCSSNLYTLSLISLIHFQRFFHILSKSGQTSCLPFLIPFNRCGIMSTFKSINDWTFDYACLVGVWSLCKPLLLWGKNLHPRLEPTFYNIYVEIDNLMILYHVISKISFSWIMINFRYFMSILTCNLLGICMPYVLRSFDRPWNFSFNNIIFSWGKCWQ